MAISSNSVITWSTITDALLTALKGVCCNIDTYKSVPDDMKSSYTAHAKTKTFTTNYNDVSDYYGGFEQQTFDYYAYQQNLIPLVTSTKVETEWSTFINDANIGHISGTTSDRTNKVIQAKDFGDIIGLAQQFMSYHLKPVCTRRQIYGSDSKYIGTKYIEDSYLGGKVTPKYTPTAVNPTSYPNVSDNDIKSLVNNNIYNPSLSGSQYWGMLNASGNPIPYKCTLGITRT